ncbi:MAG: DUF1592 domain-containing protein, partial [Gemmatimonadales bacterium]|nr:DUF1592 domain-containing protein [Gemmatimonadales bacterium]
MPLIRDVLLTAYGERKLDRSKPLHRRLLDVLGRVRSVAITLASPPDLLDEECSGSAAIQALLLELRDDALPPEPRRDAVELLDWLEVPLDDAPVVMLTGFNEGMLPESVSGHAFLPDALRSRLGLIDNRRRLARDAYRRPPTDAELDVLVDVYDLARNNDLNHMAALGLMLKAVLVSPQFLFITPAGEPESKDAIVLLDDFQLASRLSYLLWSAPPDAELAALADKDELHTPEVLRTQVERLLKDARSRALFDGFGAQWLRVNELDGQVFDPKTFPQMTPALRTAMMDEARLFFESIVSENQSVVRFVSSDYTFVNEPLAKVYGLEQSVRGPEMRR